MCLAVKVTFSAVSEHADMTVQDKCIIPKTKSHDSLQNKHMFSKFLYYRLLTTFVLPLLFVM